MNSLNSVVNTLPEGDAKDDIELKIKKLEYRKFLLDDKMQDYGTIALMDKMIDFEMIEKEITELETIKTAIETRKTEIS